MKKPTESYPHVRVQGDGRAVVSQGGSVLLVETVRRTGLDQALSAVLTPWRKPRVIHDPGKIPVDLAPAVALGGDCLADIALPRSEPAVFGPVASDPTVSRLIDTLAASGEKALTAIRAARSEVRERVWDLASDQAPDAGGQVIMDLDGVLVVAHSGKQDAAPTWKKSYGHPPDGVRRPRPGRNRRTRRRLRDRGIVPKIARRGDPHGSGLGKVRWVAESAIAWLHGPRPLRTRWKPETTCTMPSSNAPTA